MGAAQAGSQGSDRPERRRKGRPDDRVTLMVENDERKCYQHSKQRTMRSRNATGRMEELMDGSVGEVNGGMLSAWIRRRTERAVRVAGRCQSWCSREKSWLVELDRCVGNRLTTDC